MARRERVASLLNQLDKIPARHTANHGKSKKSPGGTLRRPKTRVDFQGLPTASGGKMDLIAERVRRTDKKPKKPANNEPTVLEEPKKPMPENLKLKFLSEIKTVKDLVQGRYNQKTIEAYTNSDLQDELLNYLSENYSVNDGRNVEQRKIGIEVYLSLKNEFKGKRLTINSCDVNDILPYERNPSIHHEILYECALNFNKSQIQNNKYFFTPKIKIAFAKALRSIGKNTEAQMIESL